MLKLHGFAVSNYYCIARQTLLEKGIAFEEVTAMPSQEPGYLAKSPMGKIPALETDEGFLCETDVIQDYLEEVYPTPALYPASPFQRARMREVIKMVELYVEYPAHGMVMALFGAETTQEQRDAAEAIMRRGVPALKRLVKLSPWICGDQFTAADIFTYHSLGLVAALSAKLYDWDVISEVPGLKEWRERVAQRPVTQRIDADNQAAIQAMLKQQQ